MIRSIFGRILVSHIAVVLATLLISSLFLSYLVREHMVENKRREMMFKGQNVIELLNNAFLPGRLPSKKELAQIGELVGANLWLSDETGTPLTGNPPNRIMKALTEVTSDADPLLWDRPQSWVFTGSHLPDPAIVVSLPLPPDMPAKTLFLSAPIIGVNRNAEAVEKLLYYSLAIGLFAALIFSLFISRSVTRPLANISDAAKRFAQGAFDSRTSATSNDEVGRLGRNFNTMASALADIEQNRRDFLANVSHELKTPVTSIQALSEALLDGMADTPEQQQRYLSTIVDKSHHIDRLIHDLLDLAQLEAGELSVLSQPLTLEAFCGDLSDRFQPLLAEKELALEWSFSADLPLVFADPDRLAQVFTNLISNAVRHAPEQSVIAVSVRHTGAFATVSVADTGDGIDPEHLPHIWDRFYRVDKSRARRTGGTGLGLAITKRLVEAMGGTIDVVSVPSAGTTFSFTLPVAK